MTAGRAAGRARPAIFPVGPESAEALAALHARCFAPLPERPWSAEAFRTLLAVPGVCAFAVREAQGGTGHDVAGLAVGRQGGGEAEILTICVAPHRRREGLARALAAHLFAALDGASRIFLEVAVDNDAAQALYMELGFRPAGLRPGYYAGKGTPVDALVLLRDSPGSAASRADVLK